MFGKLTVQAGGGGFPVVMAVQTAEAQTVDTRVLVGKSPIDYFDMYRREFAAMASHFSATRNAASVWETSRRDTWTSTGPSTTRARWRTRFATRSRQFERCRSNIEFQYFPMLDHSFSGL